MDPTVESVTENDEETSPGVAVAQLVAGEEMNLQHIHLEPGTGGTDTHHHPNEQIVFVYEGTLTARVGEEDVELDTGDSLLLPGDTPHAVRNEGDAAGRAVEIFSPPRE